MATSLLAEDQKYNQLIQAESGKEQMGKQGLDVNIKLSILFLIALTLYLSK